MYSIDDALLMIGELHYEKRQLVHELGRIQIEVAGLSTANADLEKQIEKLQKTAKSSPKRRAEK